MQEVEKQESMEPMEIQELKEVLKEQYPTTEITYHDYTDAYESIKESNPMILMSKGDQTSESFINPIENVGGHFRTELFVHFAKSTLPDPIDPNSRILIYPSFYKEGDLSKLRLLRYPTKVLEDVLEEFGNIKSRLNLPFDFSRLESVPKVRVGLDYKWSNDVRILEPILNFPNPLIYSYTEKRIKKLRKKARNVKWGSHTVLLYKDIEDKNILLVLDDS